MGEINPDKVHIKLNEKIPKNNSFIPRKYTLTHSDATGDLFLTELRKKSPPFRVG